MKPLIPNQISVVMTAYNSKRYIAQAIESVLSQTNVPLEIICVDDGSTDGTAEVLHSCGDKITFLEHGENRGIATGRNTGLAVARGEFVAFIDADDIWEAEKLKSQVAILQTEPSCDMVFGQMQCFLSPDLTAEEKAKYHCSDEPVVAFTPSSFLARRRVFEQVGLFDPKWRVGEFIDWLARAKDHGLTYQVLPEVVFHRRIHSSNTGIVGRPNRVDYVRIAREALRRRRLNS